MISFGQTHCAFLKDNRSSKDAKLSATYYDGIWVYHRIAAYTGDSSWESCAEKAREAYRDDYVLSNNGFVPGFWNFTDGLLYDYLGTTDPLSSAAIVLLSTNAAYARDTTPPADTVPTEVSREVAYAMQSYINARAVGEPWRPRLLTLLEHAIGHIDQWCISKTAPYVRPFMVALTAEALIAYYDNYSPDERIIPALITAMDWIWDNTWLPDQMSFAYTDRQTEAGGREPAPDLNLLIAPVYGWLYLRTHEPRFLERGDQVFEGGVNYAWIGNPKQFNQNYHWSFDYVTWRAIQERHWR